MNTVKLGFSDHNEYYEAELNADGTIRGFNGYDFIHPSSSADGNAYLNQSSWTHNVKIGRYNLKTGQVIPKNFKPKLTKKQAKQVEDAYQCEGMYCSECGTFHTDDQYINVSFKVIDCEVFCNECVDSAQLLKEIEAPSDLFKAGNITGMGEPKGFEEIEVLFCDASGFGRPTERALTKKQAEAKISEMLGQNAETLYCAVTNAGQFQVYVTIYKKDEA